MEDIIQGLKEGTRLNNGTYRIEAVLGSGSFGITYLASTKFSVQGKLGEMKIEAKVAIKEFFMNDVNSRREDGSTVEGSTGNVFVNYRKKFRKEAENLAKLGHAGIVKVSDIFDENNTTYYVMEFLEGSSLEKYIIQKKRIPEAEAIDIIKEVGDALSYMHSRNMLHLDIKPNNIMRTADGKYCLIDFGLSKQFTAKGEPESSTTIGLGTPGYAPLEQASYQKEGTFPATLDVYALGATLFKMLTGKRAPEATYILNDGFPREALEKAGVSPHTIDVVEKAMAPMKKNRYASVKDFIESLQEENEITQFIKPEEETTFTNSIEDEQVPPPAQEKYVEEEVHVNPDVEISPKRGSAKPMKHGIIFKMTHKWKKWQSYCLITACIAGWGFFAWAFTMSPYFMSEIGYTAFCNSFGIPKKYGITWIERAAEKGSNDAQDFMGRLYLEGEDGIGRNYKEAEKWFRMGAEEGNAWLAFRLGNLYSEGGYGIDKDYSEAVKWYRAVADSWDNDARVTYALGEIYEEGGYGINQDLEEALKWYRLTEETGYYYENLEAKIQELERDIYAVPVDSAC